MHTVHFLNLQNLLYDQAGVLCRYCRYEALNFKSTTHSSIAISSPVMENCYVECIIAWENIRNACRLVFEFQYLINTVTGIQHIN